MHQFNLNNFVISQVRKAYKSLMSRELVKEEILSVLDEIHRRERNDSSSPIIEDEVIEPLQKPETNCCPPNANDNMLNFEQFCCIMIELIYNQRNSRNGFTGTNFTLATTSYYVQNISGALNKLLGKWSNLAITNCAYAIFYMLFNLSILPYT